MRLPDWRQMRGSVNVRTPRRVPLLQVAKSALAIVAAWLLAGWLVQGPPPIFAAIAALLVVQPSINQSFTRAVERSRFSAVQAFLKVHSSNRLSWEPENEMPFQVSVSTQGRNTELFARMCAPGSTLMRAHAPNTRSTLVRSSVTFGSTVSVPVM